jgi:hypothetical protein
MQGVRVKRVVLIGILLIIIAFSALWLMAYQERKIIPRRVPELTVKEKALLNAAWRKHGYYKTVEVEEGCYIERGDGKIWVWRNE